ncbi:MAG: DUF5605 domain-containing protein [Oscillospiraceae bacterium]|nr:DUF5605 domain-containing protein [Oscillospiraceae bacterium]
MNHLISAGALAGTGSSAVLERWGVFEVAVAGKTDGNPFTDYNVRGVFKHKNETVEAEGFYDGGGVYRVRCMPSFEGEYSYRVFGSCMEGAAEGAFTVAAPTPGNHGPVRVANTYHFAYEDGTPHVSLGTTCYVWTHQSQELQEKTLESLKNGPFNKIRFCVFPKHYVHNFHEPITYPYEGTPCDRSGLTADNFSYQAQYEGNDWDFSRFNPEHFRLIEKRIADLMEIGVEADIIVMHPYDCWGFSKMSPDEDDLYWNYVVNRFSAFRNVWWSLANEYDLMRAKTTADWERYAAIICRQDPYNHLRSIHNCRHFYDHSRPWVTHCSVQRQDIYLTVEMTGDWRERYRKPVVLDEICYEGDIEHGWGNISGQELVRRFWESACKGGYPGHGETFVRPDDVLWWSHGGELHGESPARIAFLRDILEQAPGAGLRYERPFFGGGGAAVPEGIFDAGSYYLYYMGLGRPSLKRFRFDSGASYRVEVIDTWNMTIEDAGIHSGAFTIPLPAREYMAIRLVRQ